MRLAYLVPGVGLTARERDRRQRILRRIAAGLADVDLHEVTEGPEAIETAEDEAAAVGPLVALARARERDYDVYVIGCFGDVGIDALRSQVRIPVIGPARATYSIAGAAFPSFGILSLNSGFIPEERAFVERLGVADRVNGIEAVDLPVQTIIDDPESALGRIRALTERLDPAAVVPGCMSMAFLLEERSVTEIGAARVLNPLRCAVRVAAAMTV